MTFRKMSLRQRLRTVRMKELCQLCRRHLGDKVCWSLNRTPNCTINRCGELHHEMLHEALKEEEEAMRLAEAARDGLVKGSGAGPRPVRPDVPKKAAMTGSKRELLKGLGIDLDIMVVKVRVYEPEKYPYGRTSSKAS